MENRVEPNEQVSSQSLQIRLPKNFEKKLIWKMFEDLQEFLPMSDRKLFLAAYKLPTQRMVEHLSSFTPQSSVNEGIECEKQFFARYQLHSLLKKFVRGSTDSLEQAAVDGFLAADAVCGQVNRTISQRLLDIDSDPHLWGAVEIAQDFIRDLLGEIPPSSFFEGGRHGPGSSLLSSKGKVHRFYKYAEVPYSVTADCLALAKETIETDPLWVGALYDKYRTEHKIPMNQPVQRAIFFKWLFVIVEGNRITSVPKDASKRRTIAKEPLINLFLQLGVDKVIRQRLKRWDCDLDSQTKNQRLAKQGSILSCLSDGFATIDLKAASDSISMASVQALFPPAWYDLLFDLRSPAGQLPDGTHVRYEKISSMGNGYTFALESLIFFALSYACVEKHNQRHWNNDDMRICVRSDVAVFGDDIIVPTTISSDLITLLSHLGFSTNNDKTFTHGYFRESCGTDFFKGINVRPFFLEEDPNEVQKLFVAHNRIANCGCHVLSKEGTLRQPEFCIFSSALAFLRGYVPLKFVKCSGPWDPLVTDQYLYAEKFVRHYSGGRMWVKVLRTQAVHYRPEDFFFRKLLAFTRPSSYQFSHDTWLQEIGMSPVFGVTRRGKIRTSFSWTSVRSVHTSYALW